MNQRIALYDRDITYSVRKSKRAKRLRIAVYSDCDVVVTLPYDKSLDDVSDYVEKKGSWICKKLDYFRKAKGLRSKGRYTGFEENKEEAYALVLKIVKKFSQGHDFKYKKIVIKDHKTKWGSCTKGGILNFNFRILFLPRRLAEYVVVHELCHLKDMRHSAKYWRLVEQLLSDYGECANELKNYAFS